MIAEFKLKIESTGKTFDPLYEKRINSLEAQNSKLKARIEMYDKSQSNWESFKRQFNHDMDELGEAFAVISVDNIK
jgi:hypothetical protein